MKGQHEEISRKQEEIQRLQAENRKLKEDWEEAVVRGREVMEKHKRRLMRKQADVKAEGSPTQ